jgi:phosphoribosylaminoimidazolecarboxamide formyltransferase/IMP cyclohydrolase
MEDVTNGSLLAVVPVKRVLFSLSDKNGLGPFVAGLRELGCELMATCSTRDTLLSLGAPCASVEELTAFPQILGGRVKTLHPVIFGGILARRHNPSDEVDLAKHQIPPIDLVVCNLYPFQAALAAGASLRELVEKIDIGGVSLLRAAAKNHAYVGIVCDHRDYEAVLANLRANGGALSETFRQALALKALRETAAYDAVISAALAERFPADSGLASDWGPIAEARAAALPPLQASFPSELNLSLRRVRELRYGENPHQKAALYAIAGSGTVSHRCNIAAVDSDHGKQLSYNNVLDVEHSVRLVREFTTPTIAVIKHNTPCCVATVAEGAGARTLADLFRYAVEADPVSPFGGIVCLNREVDLALAQELNEIFLEVVVAPSFHPEARRRLEQKKNLRLIALDPSLGSFNQLSLTPVQGGFLAQEADAPVWHSEDLTTPTKLKPTTKELKELEFAFKVVKHVRSNAIVLANEGRVIAVAGGFTNRVDAVEQCLRKARVSLTGAVLASDAFFPFPDNIELLANTGIKAIVQPGGSLRDSDAIAACDRLGIAMTFSKMRHFKH